MGKRVWWAAAALVAVLLMSTIPIAAAEELVAQPNTVSLSFTGSFVTPSWYGTETKWQAKIQNSGTETITSVAFSGTFPSGMTSIAHTLTVCGGTLTVTTSTLALTYGTLTAGTSCTVAIPIKTNHVGHYAFSTSTLFFHDKNGNLGIGPKINAALDVLDPPALSIKLAATTIAKGGSTTAEILVTNPSKNTVGLPAVGFSIAIQSGLAATPKTESVCNGTLVVTASSITLTGATVPPSMGCSRSVKITGTAVGTFSLKSSGAYSTLPSGKTGAGAPAVANIVVNPTLPPPVKVMPSPTPTPTPTPVPTQAAVVSAAAVTPAAGTPSPAQSTQSATPSETPSESASAPTSDQPSAEASASTDLIAGASAGSSASGDPGLAGETMAASGSATSAPSDASGSGSGGDASPLLLLLGVLVVAAAGGGAGFVFWRRRRLGAA